MSELQRSLLRERIFLDRKKPIAMTATVMTSNLTGNRIKYHKRNREWRTVAMCGESSLDEALYCRWE